ncbi:MAG: S8 family serine peptidase, partial [Bacteroidales bacterium]
MKNMYKRKLAGKAILSLCCVLSASTGSAQERAFQNGVRQGRVVVKFKDNPNIIKSVKESSGKQRSAGVVKPFSQIPQLDQLSRLLLVDEVSPLFVANPKFQKRFEKEGLDRWFVFNYNASQSPMAVVQTLKGITEIEVAEPEFELMLPSYTIKEAKVPSMVPFSDAPVNDPMFPQQWHYHNTGQTNGKKGADVNLVNAWKKRMAANTVIVAIIDEGVDFNHEDIKANMWANEAELYGKAGVDDDGNGLIDDIYGYDFGSGTSNITKGDHGTHVAGTVAAVNNNGIGVAGVAGGSGKGDGAKMMTLPIFGSDQDRAANAFIYAADNGALITQNSYGYGTPGVSSEAFTTAIRYFTKYAGCDNEGNQLPGALMKGGLAIFAAGNVGVEGQFYPGCMEEVVAVASLTHMDQPAYYTNIGDWVDVASYGGETSKNQESGVLSSIMGNKYGYMQGTSMACPHVSGMAALSLAELGGDGFTNEMLRNYLTRTSRPNESSYDNMYKGKMGVGIVDALKAMTKNDGVAPDKINDLSVPVISDSYINIQFKAPSKGDGTRVEGYKVLLVDSLNNKREIVISSKQNPGEQESCVISELKKEMKYTVSVSSFDLWGTTSEPSNTVTFNTFSKKGNLTYSTPVFNTIRKKSDFDQEQYWEFDIELYNNSKEADAGALSWRADSYAHAHANSVPEWSRNLSQIVEATTPQLELVPQMMVSEEKSAKSDNVYEAAGYKKWITNRGAFYPDSYIGEVKENGKLFSSSMAQRFTVPSVYNEGFSLSHFDIGLRTNSFWLYDDQVNDPTNLKVVVEIYRGGDQPEIKNRIFAGTITDMPSNRISVFKPYYAPYFEQGESFWIVVHADSRYKYPIGVNGNGIRSEDSFYSSDNGATWKQLSSVYTALPQPVFTIAALSDNRKGKGLIELTPSSGYLAKGAKTKIKARMNYETLSEGLDSTLVVFSTDGTVQNGRSILTAILDLKRNDIKGEFNTDLVEMGIISQGDKKSGTVMLYNRGRGHLAIDSITLSNKSVFKLTGNLPTMIQSGDSATISVEIAPNTLGAHNTQLNVYGRQQSFSTFIIGTCVEAPTANLTPEKVSLELVDNNVVSDVLNLKNLSNYSLRFTVPSFLATSGTARERNMQIVPSPERTDTLDLKAGYSWEDNHMNRGYQGSPWVEISETGTELTNKCDAVKKYTRVKLPFTFRYYDRFVKEVFVGINGTIRMDSATATSDVPVDLPYEGEYSDLYGKYDGLIAPLWFMDGSKGHFQRVQFFYEIKEDCVIFQWQGAEVKYTVEGVQAKFQMAIYPDGKFEFRYDVPFQLEPFIANSFSIGWSSPSGYDGKTIYYSERNVGDELMQGYCIRVTPPAIIPFQKDDKFNYSGIVKPLSTVEIPYKINSELVPTGQSKFTLMVETNDPKNKTIGVDFEFNKKDVLAIEFMEDLVDFGEVIFDSKEVNKQITLFNNSNSTEEVQVKLKDGSGLLFANGSSTLDVTIESKKVKIIPVKLTGPFDTKLVVVSKDGSMVFDEMQVKATALNYANITPLLLDKKSLAFDLNAGQKETQTIKVTADHKAYSSKLFVPGYLEVESGENTAASRAAQGVKDKELDFSGYRWYSSANESAPQYIWKDISKTGTRLGIDLDVEYNGTELPFEFPFYGSKYSKIYVSPNGRISPLPIGWDVMWDYVPPVRMPDSKIQLPLISVMWNRQWYDHLNKEAGIYFEANEERAIIQYNQFQLDWVVSNGVTSYQAILYKDGTVQFVYKDIESCDLKDFVTIGMQGVAGSSKETDGFTYTLNSSNPIKSRTTITAKPMFGPFKVEAGKTIDLRVSANSYGYKAGTYKDSIVFVSENNQEISKIPITMTVGSNANLVAKEAEVNYGQIICGEAVDYKLVNLQNDGNQDISITAARFDGADKDIFALKRKVVVTEGLSVVVKYLPLEFPFTLGAYATETLYAEITPLNQTKECTSNLIFETSANNLQIPFKASILKPAELAVTTADNRNEMVVDLSNVTTTIRENLKVSYLEGVNPLDFTLFTKVAHEPIATQRKQVKASELSYQPFGTVQVAKTPMSEMERSNIKPTAISSESIEPFREISVIGNQPPVAILGANSVGAYYGISFATKMNTGEKGFLLSHIRAWTNTDGRDTSHVTVRIYNDCESPSNKDLIYEKVHKLKMEVPLVGEVYIPLEKNIPFAPNQNFWVELYYGPNHVMPMAVADIPEGGYPDRNKYRLFNGRTDVWSDFYEYPGYFAIWAVQESFSDLTQWIELSASSATIAPSQNVNVDAKINYLHFPMSEMNMEVSAKTNKLSVTKPLLIKAKKYEDIEWVTFPQESFIVKEGSQIAFDVKAVDPNGKEITYRLSSPVEGVVVSKNQDGSARIEYTAPYNSSFLTNLNIEARTETGLSLRRVSIANINVNRSPKALEVAPINLNVNSLSALTLPPSYFFVDPDGDQLQYRGSISSSGVNVALSEKGFVFTPVHEDVVDIILWASDGKTEVTNRFRVNVINSMNTPPVLI